MRKSNKRKSTRTLSTANVASKSHGESSTQRGSNSHSEQDDISGIYTQTNTRGVMTGKTVWFIADPEKRFRLQLNKYNQPVGESALELSTSCGVVARMPHLCPIIYNDWRVLRKAFEGSIMAYVKERFNVSSSIEEKVILQTIGHAWTCHKTNLRKIIYAKDEEGNPLKTKAELLEADNVPFGVPMVQWIQFVNYWLSAEGIKISQKHKEIRAMQEVLHTTGRKSYARKRDEMEIEKKREIGAVEFFITTHTSNNGNMKDHVRDVVEQCNALLSDALLSERVSTEDEDEDMMSSTARIHLEDEVLQEVQGPEHPGRVRGAGRGPTPFTWRSKRTDMSDEVQCLRSQLEILTKREAEREQREAERDKRDAERDVQVAKMEKIIEDLMRRNAS